jgi:hypothetical protein
MYSVDLIKAGVKYVKDKGHTIEEFSEAFGVNKLTVTTQDYTSPQR